MCTACLSRRAFLLSASALPLAGCDRLSLVSDAEAERMGLAAWEDIRRSTPLSRNRDYGEMVGRVAGRLLRGAGLDPAGWQFAVFAGDTVNAFALPGRRIGVYEGMIRAAGGEGPLAAVVGHEIGHLEAEHPKERMSAQMAGTGLLRVVSWALNLGEVEYAEEIAAALGLGVEFGLLRPYGRDQETEADRLGVAAMARAGYDPADAVRLWEGMAARGRRGPEFLSTHPAPASRVRDLREAIAAL